MFTTTRLQLQDEQLSLVDFYKAWIECELEIETFLDNRFVNEIKESMAERAN